MIDREQLLVLMRDEAYRPLMMEELETALGVLGDDPDARAELHALCEEMVQEGYMIRTRTKRYGVPERMDLVVGTLQVKQKGFGFLVPLHKSESDVYIGAADLGGAMDGDRVVARLKKNSGTGRREGEIFRVLKRAHTQIVGVIHTTGSLGFVRSDDKRLPREVVIPADQLNGAVDGHKVVVEITEFPEDVFQSPAGIVREVLGFPHDPGVDILSVIRKFGIPEHFPDEVLQAAESISYDLTEDDLAGRRDLRDEIIVTIDGADAKDLDDAVAVKRVEHGYVLSVHIADVTYYVKENSLLDREAYARGTSVYLVDRVIPMLPPRLSNGICSLHPQVDRLTLTCEMEWDDAMHLVRHDIYPSVIRTTERMTYDAVRDLLEGDASTRERYAALVPFFEGMKELALKLRHRRMERGAVDFDFAETKIRVDEEGRPLDLVRRERSIAEMIIEEFMLAANETVAEHAYWMELPFLYRVHEPPTLEKMMALNEFVHLFGHHLKAAGNIHPRALQDLLAAVRQTPEEVVISHVMLRSMKQARYAAESLGHFGLAAEYYSHFTSPIRRYPDLMIHRILRETIVNGSLSEGRAAYLAAKMPEIAAHTSDRERVAVDAERETDLIKKIEFMRDHVGESFEGMVSGVTGFGLFVQLDNSVEGLIHVSQLADDYYHYDDKQHALIGERTKKRYRIGDRVEVLVQSASKEQMQIEFQLLSAVSGDEVREYRRQGASKKPGMPFSGGPRGKKPGGGRGGKRTDDPNGQGAGRSTGGQRRSAGGKGFGGEREARGGRTAVAEFGRRDPETPDLRYGDRELLPRKGGYAVNKAAPDEQVREERKRDKDLLRQVENLYGVPVKDKVKRRRRKKAPDQV
ncbi:ribonuclease R [Ferroacidibacillus organovorans]|nr:ribonuclease R [Ferroacidibacillus organovorans]